MKSCCAISRLSKSRSSRWRISASLRVRLSNFGLYEVQLAVILGVVVPAHLHAFVRPLNELVADRRRDEVVARMDRANRGHELFRFDVLEDLADGTGVERAEHVVVVIEGRKDQDLDIRMRLENRPRSRGAVHHRHADVHQDHVRPQAVCHANRLPAVLGDAGHRYLVLAVAPQDDLDAVGEEPLVIGDQNL